MARALLGPLCGPKSEFRTLVGSSCAAVIVAVAALSAAQITPQVPTQSPLQAGSQRPGERPAPPGESSASKAQLTVTGCLTRELDRRPEAANRGEGELLLRADGVAPAAPGSDRDDGAVPARPGNPDGDRPRGTSGRGGVSYRLSGSLETELASHVGERVEVVGTVSVSDPEKPASDSTDSVPQLTVLSFKPASGSCR